MRKLITALTLSATSLGAASAFGQTTINADITGPTTWTTAGSPYILEGPIFVRDGGTLTIQPGVIVRGQPRNGGTLPAP
jgi:hypothetical protein